MAKRTIQRGTTGYVEPIIISDATSTTGSGKTGLAYNTAGLTCYYKRKGANAAVAVALAAGTIGQAVNSGGAGTGGGFVEVDATHMPGLYELTIPDAALATGADSVVVTLLGATGMVQVNLEIELVAYAPLDAVHLGLSALPNAAAAATGGLPIADSAGRVAALLAAYGANLDPLTMLRTYAINPNPASGSLDELWTAERNDLLGTQVETPSTNTIDVYNPDGTHFATITFTPNLSSPTRIAAARSSYP